jgi:hypothetical protein
MRPNVIDIDVADASLTGFASNITGAGPWTTFSATTDGLAHQVSLRNDSATNYAGQTFTIVGLNEDGDSQSEAVTGPGGTATVESALYFSSITSITASGAGIGADTIDVGWVDEVSSQTYPLDWRSPYSANITVDVTGTIDFTVQQTFVDVLGGVAPVWSAITALASKTADTTSTAAVGATAIRVIVNSYSSGAELQMYTTQASDC